MQWKNKAHELDSAAGKLLENSDRFKNIYIFGAGLVGAKTMITMCEYGILKGFIDNDINKQERGYRGFKVFSLEGWINTQKIGKGGCIVVAVGRKFESEIVRQLEDAHLSEGEDFVSHDKFFNFIFPIVSLYAYNKLFVNLAQICLTERCTLKCRKCAHGCFAVDINKAEDLTIEQVRKSADSFFGNVDFIEEFVLIGGEPLLYRQLPDAIEYIGEHYRRQIGIFSITTNGTVMPDEETLKLCKKYNVMFRISNYSAAVPKLKTVYGRLTDTLGSNGINYSLGREDGEWVDYGFDYVNRGVSAEELINVFDTCKTHCREVRENRFYFCVMARSVSENMGFNVGEDDYLDLDALQGERGKKELLEFNFGYSEKGYLDMCNYCNGADSVKHPIPVAEQI